MPGNKQYQFRLLDFMGVKVEIITKLENLGIKTAGQMLAEGCTEEKRLELARRAGITLEDVLELKKLSDLARLPGVKGIRARLYFDAGVDTVEKLASLKPEALLTLTAEFVQRTGFKGIAPLPKEVSSTIANAQKLPKIVNW